MSATKECVCWIASSVTNARRILKEGSGVVVTRLDASSGHLGSGARLSDLVHARNVVVVRLVPESEVVELFTVEVGLDVLLIIVQGHGKREEKRKTKSTTMISPFLPEADVVFYFFSS